MKRSLNILTILILVHGCSIIFAKEQPWSFVTAVGGLAVGTPVPSNGRWLLPVRADVSGTQVIANKPTTLNSGLVCEAVRAKVKGQDIFLTIKTTLAHKGATSVCPAAKLGRLSSGRYDVWYGTSRAEGTSLGTVRVSL